MSRTRTRGEGTGSTTAVGTAGQKDRGDGPSIDAVGGGRGRASRGTTSRGGRGGGWGARSWGRSGVDAEPVVGNDPWGERGEGGTWGDRGDGQSTTGRGDDPAGGPWGTVTTATSRGDGSQTGRRGDGGRPDRPGSARWGSRGAHLRWQTWNGRGQDGAPAPPLPPERVAGRARPTLLPRARPHGSRQGATAEDGGPRSGWSTSRVDGPFNGGDVAARLTTKPRPGCDIGASGSELASRADVPVGPTTGCVSSGSGAGLDPPAAHRRVT